MKKLLKIILYFILAHAGLYFAILGFISLRYVWYVYFIETDLGEPAFQTEGIVKEWPGDQLTVAQRAALHRFPSLASCVSAETNTPSAEELMQMDWTRMQNSAHVEVCAFRILKTLGDISLATSWLEQQGFSSPERWSSENPFKESNGTLKVIGTWNVIENGLRWPESGLKRRMLSIPILLPPYEVGIETTWSPDGEELLFIEVFEKRL